MTEQDIAQLTATGWYMQAQSGHCRCLHPLLPKVTVNVTNGIALVSYGSNTGCTFIVTKAWFVSASLEDFIEAITKHATGG